MVPILNQSIKFDSSGTEICTLQITSHVPKYVIYKNPCYSNFHFAQNRVLGYYLQTIQLLLSHTNPPVICFFCLTPRRYILSVIPNKLVADNT